MASGAAVIAESEFGEQKGPARGSRGLTRGLRQGRGKGAKRGMPCRSHPTAPAADGSVRTCELTQQGGTSASRPAYDAGSSVAHPGGGWQMRVSDDLIGRLLDVAVKATDEGQKRAASALVKLLRSGRSDMAALEELAADLAKRWGPEIKQYYWDLCRKLGLCD